MAFVDCDTRSRVINKVNICKNKAIESKLTIDVTKILNTSVPLSSDNFFVTVNNVKIGIIPDSPLDKAGLESGSVVVNHLFPVWKYKDGTLTLSFQSDAKSEMFSYQRANGFLNTFKVTANVTIDCIYGDYYQKN